MPLYEFDCPDCHKAFEALVRGFGQVADVECPSCKSHQVHKKLSTFASKVETGTKLGSSQFTPACETGGG